jgi:hypothetical protein
LPEHIEEVAEAETVERFKVDQHVVEATLVPI